MFPIALFSPQVGYTPLEIQLVGLYLNKVSLHKLCVLVEKWLITSLKVEHPLFQLTYAALAHSKTIFANYKTHFPKMLSGSIH